MTKDTHFSLSTVLKYRKSIEEEVARDTAAYKKMLDDELLLIMDMERRKEESIRRYREKSSQTVEEITLFHSFLAAFDNEIERQKKKVSDMTRIYERKREELISAAMDKKIMETLRDKEWDAYQKMLSSGEQKELDEMASNNYGKVV